MLVFVLVAALVAQLVVGLPSQRDLRSLLDGFGPAAIPAFIALYVAVSLLPVGPSGVLTVVGGALLGFPVALAAVLVGAVSGAAVAFSIGRVLGRDVVSGLSGERLRALDARVRDHGFATVLVARLVPVIPFTTLNYACGLTSISWRAYLAATAVGIVPGTTLYVAVGAYGASPGSWPFVLAVTGLVALTLVGVAHSRRAGRQADPRSDPQPAPPSGEDAAEPPAPR